MINTQTIRVGDRVSYEDMANPRRDGMIVNFHDTQWGREWLVMWQDGGESMSDCRQHGWHKVSA